MKVINTNNAPKAVGPYCQAMEVNGFLYLSGQVPINPETGKIDSDDIKGQTEQVFKNINEVLKAAGYKKEDVIKSTVLLASMDDFAAMNEVYAQFYGEHKPTRCAFAVKELPLKSLVEIETIAYKR